MSLIGYPIEDKIRRKMNSLWQAIAPQMGEKVQELQDTTKKSIVGTYNFAIDADSFNFANADVNLTANTITEAVHGLVTGDAVVLSTTGTLPTGLSAATAYYVIRVTTDTFKLATTRANAFAGTAIDITAITAPEEGGDEPVHTLKKNVFGQINLLEQGQKLPDNAVITRAFYNVLTTFADGASDTATIALQVNAANDIKTATAIATTGDIWDAGAFVAGVPDNAVGNMLKLTADRELIMAVAVAPITAGKMDVFIEYVLGN